MENEKIVELEKDVLVSAKNVGMSFKTPKFRYDTMKERAVALFKGSKNEYKYVTVLEDVSFQIKRGQSLGVIGHNGAGKSTLLRLVAGIFGPTSGSISTQGKIVLLNFGTGFDPDANAIENIYLNGALLGFSHNEMKQKIDSILEFAELEDYVKLPIKNYSSGMISRLGFAIAIDVKPDLLLIDEVLSVGDINFQKKCQQKIDELKSSGVSFMFVSHNVNQVQRLCEYTLWIENSKVIAYGPSEIVCKKYSDYCQRWQERWLERQKNEKKDTGTDLATSNKSSE